MLLGFEFLMILGGSGLSQTAKQHPLFTLCWSVRFLPQELEPFGPNDPLEM
jgi:hypothetical protein